MAKNNKPVIAVDIGGTKIMTALFSADGKILDKDVSLTRAGEGVDAVVNRLVSAINDILQKE